MISDKAVVAPTATVNPSAKVWDFAQIRESAVVEAEVIIGASVYIGAGVKIGARSKIQNDALIYEPAVVSEGVFIGPGAILTNDRNPRAINADSSQKSVNDWHPVGVTIHNGASIGAGAVCIAPITIGRWAMVAAGSVVTTDVADYSLVAGNPARHIGWVGKSGYRLSQDGSSHYFACPVTGEKYSLINGTMVLA